MPCSQKRARKLLAAGRARVHRLMPFVIRVVDRQINSSSFQPLRIKIDPGSKVSGIALVREVERVDSGTGEVQFSAAVLSLMELVHRGRQISEALSARSNMRRRRRGTLRYRSPRFLNRTKPKGWLAPSLQHRVDTTKSWVQRLRCWAPVTAISSELVRFDMQRIQNPEIVGVEYSQGALAGYELREYLLEKWGRRCAYCDKADLPLQIEHIQAKAQGGGNRASNLTLACGPCNQRKAANPIEKFLSADSKRLARILAGAKRPLRDAAAVNATRWALAQALKLSGLPVELASGGRTKFNRMTLGIPKTHALDAACVGNMASIVKWRRPALIIKCTGRGSYQRTRLDRYGFPRGYLMRAKRVHGFGTGDHVLANVPTGKKTGQHTGRVAIRASGSFNIQASSGLVQGLSHRHCRVTQRADGYGYFFNVDSKLKVEKQGRATHAALSLPGLKAEVSRAN